MHRSRVRRAIAGGTVAGAMLLASLGAAPAPTPMTAPTPAPTSSAPTGSDDPLARFHDQRVRWGACPEKPVPAEMRCAVVEVPLDYAAPGKGTVKLALGRLPATDPDRRIGSLLINFGGPGAPGLAGLAADPKAWADHGGTGGRKGIDPPGGGPPDPPPGGGARGPRASPR
ncbi:alpha/beta hydrolase, partial [Streptomyces sp. NPDC059742]